MYVPSLTSSTRARDAGNKVMKTRQLATMDIQPKQQSISNCRIPAANTSTSIVNSFLMCSFHGYRTAKCSMHGRLEVSSHLRLSQFQSVAPQQAYRGSCWVPGLTFHVQYYHAPLPVSYCKERAAEKQSIKTGLESGLEVSTSTAVKASLAHESSLNHRLTTGH